MCFSFDGHLGYFHVLDIVNSATLNIGMHGSFWIMFLSGCVPMNGITGSYDSFSFFFFKKPPGREEGGGLRMGNTCILVADSF